MFLLAFIHSPNMATIDSANNADGFSFFRLRCHVYLGLFTSGNVREDPSLWEMVCVCVCVNEERGRKDEFSPLKKIALTHFDRL